MTNNNLNSKMLTIVIIGSYPDRVKGSLLRQFNMWYTLKNLRYLRVIYIPLTKHLVHGIRHVLLSDVVILSGTGSSIYSFLIIFIRKLLRKRTLIDFHGLGWYETSIIYGSTDLKYTLKRTLTFMHEFLSYKFAEYVVAASYTLSYILKKHFGLRKNLYVIENSVTPIFEKIVYKLRAMNIIELKRRLFDTFKVPSNAFILLCPLPVNFASNKLAVEALKKIVKHLDEKVYVLVTGAKFKGEEIAEKVRYTGYISYVEYVALMLLSCGVLLPYPSNAICGGVRNKVIEAGYCKKVTLSTKTGMLFTDAKPWIHYYPIDDLLASEDSEVTGTILSFNESKYYQMAEEFKKYIDARHSYARFRHDLLELLLEIIRSCNRNAEHSIR